MDTKRLIPLMIVVMAVAIGWQYFIGYLYKINPQWKQPGQEIAATQPAEVSQPGQTTSPTAAPTLQVGTTFPSTLPSTLPVGTVALPPAPVAPPGLQVGDADVETSVPTTGFAIGSMLPNDPTFSMGLRINPIGAGLDEVVLNAYKPPVKQATGAYTFQQPYLGMEDVTRPLATRQVVVNGQVIDLSRVTWIPLSTNATSATFGVVINDARGVALLNVRKNFEVFPTTAPGMGYEMVVKQTFENLTAAPVTVRTTFNGPNTPPRELEHGYDRQVITGYESSGRVLLGHRTVEEFGKDAPSYELKNDKNGHPIVWGGQGSVYFNAIVLPTPITQGSIVPTYISRVTASAINPDSAPETRKIAMTFETGDLTIAPASNVSIPVTVFFGPKKRSLLKSDYYALAPRNYDETLLLTGGCTMCTFQSVVDVLVWLLDKFHTLTRDWGLAIIMLVCLVRILLHPITKKSTINMQKMTKLGPEAERLKKKYGDNKEELNRQMMQLYKSQGFAPVLGCLPMFLQMPIWIALYSSLQSTFELRQQPFLYGLTWINDLAKPDHLIEFDTSYVLPLGIVFSGINLLPFLLAVVFWMQVKLQPKAPNPTPEQAQQQKMMQWITLLFPIFLYSGPSGLNIYILTSTTIGIIEAKIIRDHIKKREELEKEVVIVDGPTPKYDKAPPKTKGKLAQWIESLQAKAEQMQKNQGNQSKKKK